MVDIKHHPHRRSQFLRPSMVSLAVATGTAVLLAGLYLLCPSSLGFTVSGPGGGLVLFLPLLWVYNEWGEGSWRAEVALWVTALLSILGTIGLEAGICAILSNTTLFSPNGATYVQCSADHLRAGVFSHAFGGLVPALILWLVLRHNNAQIRKNRA